MPVVFSPSGTLTPTVSHRFRESTLEDVADTVNGMTEIGSADFAFGLSFDHSGGAITSVTLTVELRMAMPVWVNHESRPQPEQDEWSRAMRALRVHEDGHIDIIKDEAPTSLAALEAATPSTINGVLDTETARVQAVGDAYDVRTGHGTTQRTPHGTTVITAP